MKITINLDLSILTASMVKYSINSIKVVYYLIGYTVAAHSMEDSIMAANHNFMILHSLLFGLI